jgi:hypothetical protein
MEVTIRDMENDTMLKKLVYVVTGGHGMAGCRRTRALDKPAANPVATALTSPRTAVEAIGVTFPV